jgi:hypothetical protein
MTQAELENELAALRARLTQLEDGLSARKSQWDKIASQSKLLGYGCAAAAVVFSLAQIATPGRHLASPLAIPFLCAAIVLGLLAQLRMAAGKPGQAPESRK